jgi:hypothetical protein
VGPDIGCTNVFFTIVAILLLDRLGRRFFFITGRRCGLSRRGDGYCGSWQG